MPSFTITNRKKQDFTVHYDEEDTELLAQYTWCILSAGYVVTNDRTVAGEYYTLPMHRRIMEVPCGVEVDHKNGDRLDNRKENLRVCTRTENQRNAGKQKNNRSGYKGVSLHKQCQRFQARIHIKGRGNSLGLFNTALEAAHAYNTAAKKLFGEFARLNDLPALSSHHRRNIS